MVLVSHKTRTPYKGPAYDLHKAAWDWLEKHGFFSSDGLGWNREQVFFEETKQEKIAQVQAQGCTHYIDDLPEILDMLPSCMQAILYDPNNNHTNQKSLHLTDWSLLTKCAWFE